MIHQTVDQEPYDAIIAGASFAGLAAARRLRGRILLIDRQPIGEGVTSACAAPVRTVEMMGAESSIQQTHQMLVIHTARGPVEWALPEPFCTFDYRRFCVEAAAGARGIEFRLASILGRDGDVLRTSSGEFRARFLIDATGPRAALGGPGRPRHVAFGLESEIRLRVDPGLHFYFLPEVPDGYAWAFPCGTSTRFGVLSYRGRTKLLPALERFMARFDARPGGRHGGYLATGWTPGVIDNVFIAGDAAGHCLPVSGEGIRTAVLAGFRCGQLVQAVLDDAMTLDDATRAYQDFCAAGRRLYRRLLWGNLLLMELPQRWLGGVASLVARPHLLRWFFARYFGIFESREAGPALIRSVNP